LTSPFYIVTPVDSIPYRSGLLSVDRPPLCRFPASVIRMHHQSRPDRHMRPLGLCKQTPSVSRHLLTFLDHNDAIYPIARTAGQLEPQTTLSPLGLRPFLVFPFFRALQVSYSPASIRSSLRASIAPGKISPGNPKFLVTSPERVVL